MSLITDLFSNQGNQSPQSIQVNPASMPGGMSPSSPLSQIHQRQSFSMSCPLSQIVSSLAQAQPQTPTPSSVTQGATSQSGGPFNLPPSSATYQEQDPMHRGILGAGRSILGFLNDFIMSHLHMPKEYLYAPSNENREMHAAMQGYGDTPQSSADAIARLGSINDAGAQQMADQLRQQYAEQGVRGAQQQSSQDWHDAQIAAKNQAMSDKAKNDVGNYLNTLNKITDPDKKAASYAAIRPRLIAAYSDQIGNNSDGTSRLDSLLPQTLTPDTQSMLDAFNQSGTSVAKQTSLDQSQDKINNQVAQYGTTQNNLMEYRKDLIANGRMIANANLAKAAAMGQISQADMQKAQIYGKMNTDPVTGQVITMSNTGGANPQRSAPTKNPYAGIPDGTVTKDGKFVMRGGKPVPTGK